MGAISCGVALAPTEYGELDVITPRRANDMNRAACVAKGCKHKDRNARPGDRQCLSTRGGSPAIGRCSARRGAGARMFSGGRGDTGRVIALGQAAAC